MPNNNQNTTAKRLTSSMVIIVLLALCLAITTAALVFSMVSVESNLFQTGTVKINLNDGAPVITELNVEPGMTFEKSFFIQNDSTCDVYYRLYFQNVAGGLADVLEVKILYGDKVLFSGTPNELSDRQAEAADDVLAIGERRELTITFHFPEAAGNEAQNLGLTFDLAADAVQTKNNTDKTFE